MSASMSAQAAAARTPGGGTRITANVLGKNGVANARVRSRLIGGINAKAAVLSKKELAKVCLNAGGGSACGSGDRSQILGVLDTRLAVLQPGPSAQSLPKRRRLVRLRHARSGRPLVAPEVPGGLADREALAVPVPAIPTARPLSPTAA